MFGIDNLQNARAVTDYVDRRRGLGREVGSDSGQRETIKNANVSIQCEFYANDKVKSKIRATLW